MTMEELIEQIVKEIVLLSKELEEKVCFVNQLRMIAKDGKDKPI